MNKKITRWDRCSLCAHYRKCHKTNICFKDLPEYGIVNDLPSAKRKVCKSFDGNLVMDGGDSLKFNYGKFK